MSEFDKDVGVMVGSQKRYFLSIRLIYAKNKDFSVAFMPAAAAAAVASVAAEG